MAKFDVSRSSPNFPALAEKPINQPTTTTQPINFRWELDGCAIKHENDFENALFEVDSRETWARLHFAVVM